MTIRLQMAHIEGVSDTVLLVDSDAKTAKENSMYELFTQRYEDGLKKIKKGIEGKGTKKRDKVQNRLGRLNAKFPGMRINYDIDFHYNEKGIATSMTWARNKESDTEARKMHGKYLLQTSLNEKDEVNIWEFYNVIRMVKDLQDLEERP